MPHEVLRHFKDVPYDLQAQVNHYTYFHEYPDGTKTVFTNGPVPVSYTHLTLPTTPYV